jgi:hypothetical protein
MLQRVSNDLEEPISIFVHQGQLYTHVGPHHDRALEQFSIVTRSDGLMTAGIERTQAFIFDPEQNTLNEKKTKKKSDNKGWFVVELEREVTTERIQEETSGRAFGLGSIAWTRVTRKEWKASETREWRHTLDVLGGDHDEKLIVTPAHKEVIEDLAVLADSDFRLVPHSSESSDRPKKRKISDRTIEWKNSDTENATILADEYGLDSHEQVTQFVDCCFSECKEPVRRTYRSTLDGEVLGVVERRCKCHEEWLLKNAVPCHPESQSNIIRPCTEGQSEGAAHQSSPLVE